jgi:hypothetical protein
MAAGFAPADSRILLKEEIEMRNPGRWAAWLFLPALMLGVTASAEEYRKTAPEGVKLYIISPENGASVKSPFTVRFGLSGMGVAPAGVAKERTGHHHILIDTDPKDLDMSQPLPATDKIRHFGGGQSEAMLELPPGKHTLQLVLGDENHVPFNPPLMSEKITIRVK